MLCVVPLCSSHPRWDGQSFGITRTSNLSRVWSFWEYEENYTDHLEHAERPDHCIALALSSRRWLGVFRSPPFQRNRLFDNKRMIWASRAMGVHVPIGYRCCRKGHLSKSKQAPVLFGLYHRGPYTRYADAACQGCDRCLKALGASRLCRPTLQTLKKLCSVSDAFYFSRVLFVKRHFHNTQHRFEFNLLRILAGF